MNTVERREKLMCIGGPFSGRRVSIPAGLQWFALAEERAESPELDDSILFFESLPWIVLDSSDADLPPVDTAFYERRRFVSGEKGLVEVLSFTSGGNQE